MRAEIPDLHNPSQLEGTVHLAGTPPLRRPVSTPKPSATGFSVRLGLPKTTLGLGTSSAKALFSTKISQICSLPDEKERKMIYEQNATYPLSDTRLYARARISQHIKRLLKKYKLLVVKSLWVCMFVSKVKDGVRPR